MKPRFDFSTTDEALTYLLAYPPDGDATQPGLWQTASTVDYPGEPAARIWNDGGYPVLTVSTYHFLRDQLVYDGGRSRALRQNGPRPNVDNSYNYGSQLFTRDFEYEVRNQDKAVMVRIHGGDDVRNGYSPWLWFWMRPNRLFVPPSDLNATALCNSKPNAHYVQYYPKRGFHSVVVEQEPSQLVQSMSGAKVILPGKYIHRVEALLTKAYSTGPDYTPDYSPADDTLLFNEAGDPLCPVCGINHTLQAVKVNPDADASSKPTMRGV